MKFPVNKSIFINIKHAQCSHPKCGAKMNRTLQKSKREVRTVRLDMPGLRADEKGLIYQSPNATAVFCRQNDMV
jgi:hypothetical protein